MIGPKHVVTICAAAALCGITAARADSVADFYKGRTLTIMVGFGAGGGYDMNARLFAPHFEKHIPGHPTVVVQNMPGAGSMKSANYLFEVAPKDGTTIGTFAASTALEPLFGNKAAHYDPRKFEWIGSLTQDTASCGLWKGAGQDIANLPQLISAKRTVTFGASSPAAITSQHPLFLKNMFNANLKVIYGYKGTHDVSLAMQRGEVNGTCGMFESSVRGAFEQYVKSGDLKIFVQFGRQPVPFFGDATVMYDMLKTPQQKKIADVIFRQSEIARPLAAPPGTPKDRVAALRKALLDTMQDPEMIAAAAKLNIEFKPLSGEEAGKLLDEFYATPPDIVKRAAQMTQPKKN